MEFYPASTQLPDERATERLLLRPLRTTDVEQDYEAVMSSAAMLRAWSQSDWPSDQFTLQENLADLERHEREHLQREAFTFTVLEPAGSRCLGCVYIVPLWPQVSHLCQNASHPAMVSFWVRESELAGALDRHLLATLRHWLQEAWAFDCLVYTISQPNERQAKLFQEEGLVLRHTCSSPTRRGRWLAFTGPAHPTGQVSLRLGDAVDL